LNILIISNLRPNKSGITEQVYNLEKGFIQESHKVTLVSTYGTVIERIKGIYKSFREAFSCDLIIGAGCAFYGFFPIAVASTVAYFASRPVLFNFHDGQAEAFLKKSGKLIRFFIGKNRVVIASEFVNEIFERYCFNTELIPNIFDFESFYEKEDGFSWNTKVIWARSFESIYQPELALNIALRTLEKTECEFHFYGNGMLQEEMKSKYSNTKIIFHGLVPREKILKELSESSVFLNTTAFDNMPNSFFESGYYKLLAVSTKVGGIATTFSEDEIVFSAGNNADSFSEILCDVFQNPAKYDSYRLNLNKKVLKYNWNNVREKWSDLLKKYERKNHE
jgi:hypothetical protein